MSVVGHRFLKVRRTMIDVSCVESKREGILLYRPGRWWLRWIPVVMSWFAWMPWPGKRLECLNVGMFGCSNGGGHSGKTLAEVWEEIEETIGPCKFVTIYLGNGSEKSKLTIKARLESGRDVIVKLGNTRAAAGAIRNEWEILKKLQVAGFGSQVPEVIVDVGCAGEWTWSVQTVLPRGTSPSRLQKEHFEFLAKLKEAGISHGDFAPWNCAIVEGKLVVWDWEDAGPWVAGKDEGGFRKQVRELLGVSG